MQSDFTCSVDQCIVAACALGMCDTHYRRWKRNGSTDEAQRERIPLEDRFWAKVDKRDPDECWMWLGGSARGGYGTITEGGRYGRRLRASRVSYEIHNGPIPEGMFVCHTCDNPPRVNPSHLWIGTAADNHADMDAKGRRRYGTGRSKPNAKLTESRVREIRRRVGEGETRASVAREFGVHSGVVVRVVQRQAWAHVE